MSGRITPANAAVSLALGKSGFTDAVRSFLNGVRALFQVLYNTPPPC